MTDEKNNYSTYIFIEVLEGVKIDVKEGKNFTVALKQDGTVWSYGTNANGELGTGNHETKSEPVKINGINDIKAISAGYSHSLALTKMGEVYTWGLGTSGQLGNGDIDSKNIPVKVDGILNIKKIVAYKNMSVALSEDGIVYAWGEGFSTLPMRVIFKEKVVDISGNIVLTKNGRIYSITDTNTPIEDLYNMAKISCGEAHYLGITPDGTVYAWGTNSNGECGTGSASPKEIALNMTEISAGNQISMFESDDRKVYVLGNNANGRIGLGTTAKTENMTEITALGDKKAENISAGNYTHSGIIDEDGFVWHSGTGTSGELGIGDNSNKNVFTRTGDTVITSNPETPMYLDIEETVNIHVKLENTFNLKVDVIDDVQENFEIVLVNSSIVEQNDKTITAKQYGNTKGTIRHKTSGKTKEVEILIIVKMESIVQGFRDTDLPDGNYTIRIKEQNYDVELINYYDDMEYSLDVGEVAKIVELGDSTTEYKMLVVKYHKDLKISEGVTLTAKRVGNLTYKKGMFICALGDIENKGTISMTARGTYNCEGEDVYLWKNIDDTYEYVPAVGAAGGETGKRGENAQDRQTGGGSSGGVEIEYGGRGGQGSAGTSYSGGTRTEVAQHVLLQERVLQMEVQEALVELGIDIHQEEVQEILEVQEQMAQAQAL